MASTLVNSQEQYPDLSIYHDGNVEYTKDNLTSGLYRFINFTQSSGGGIFGDKGITTQLDPGLFKKNPNGWDIKKACEWLHSHSSTTSQHACAKYVRMAIEAGGVSTDGRPNWAWKYIDYLPNIGFEFIGKVSRDKMKTFNAQPGDIAVYQKNGDPSVPGHICMWTGVQWTSDFKQSNMIVYGNTQEAYLFRFKS